MSYRNLLIVSLAVMAGLALLLVGSVTHDFRVDDTPQEQNAEVLQVWKQQNMEVPRDSLATNVAVQREQQKQQTEALYEQQKRNAEALYEQQKREITTIFNNQLQTLQQEYGVERKGLEQEWNQFINMNLDGETLQKHSNRLRLELLGLNKKYEMASTRISGKMRLDLQLLEERSKPP